MTSSNTLRFKIEQPMRVFHVFVSNYPRRHLVLCRWLTLGLLILYPAEYPGVSKQSYIPPIDGVSLLPTFASDSLKRDKPLFFEYGSDDGSACEWSLHNR